MQHFINTKSHIILGIIRAELNRLDFTLLLRQSRLMMRYYEKLVVDNYLV